MYVRDTDPLPPNSQNATGCASWANDLRASMNASIANAQAASASIAGPASFSQFGPNVVIDVARSQNGMKAAGLPVVTQDVSLAKEMQAAPTVLPLNVTEDEYGSCCTTKGPVKPMQVKPQTIIMPARMDLPLTIPQSPQTLAAPNYSNLCWALRNGAVDQSQFDPAEYQALQYKCSQLGYAGACEPPPLIALWLDQQRRAGTLPHITVRPSDLDGIPQAPDLTAKSCTQSWAMAGMSGYRRGMGAPWGDAGSRPSTAGWPPQNGNAGGTNWRALALFGVLAAGVYVASKRR